MVRDQKESILKVSLLFFPVLARAPIFVDDDINYLYRWAFITTRDLALFSRRLFEKFYCSNTSELSTHKIY